MIVICVHSLRQISSHLKTVYETKKKWKNKSVIIRKLCGREKLKHFLRMTICLRLFYSFSTHFNAIKISDLNHSDSEKINQVFSHLEELAMIVLSWLSIWWLHVSLPDAKGAEPTVLTNSSNYKIALKMPPKIFKTLQPLKAPCTEKPFHSLIDLDLHKLIHSWLKATKRKRDQTF